MLAAAVDSSVGVFQMIEGKDELWLPYFPVEWQKLRKLVPPHFRVHMPPTHRIIYSTCALTNTLTSYVTRHGHH